MKLELTTRYCNILEILNLNYKINSKFDQVNFYFVRKIVFRLLRIFLFIS